MFLIFSNFKITNFFREQKWSSAAAAAEWKQSGPWTERLSKKWD